MRTSEAVTRKVGLACLFLVIVTFILFSQVRHFEFVNFDDDAYILKNPNLQKGLTLESIQWAFEADLTRPTENLDYWQPLTVLSRICEIQWFGLNSVASHMINVTLHALNVLLVFFLFWKMTGGFWCSVCVALLFGIHPVQAEAVAWITARKDVLASFFGLSCLASYSIFYLHKSRKWYLFSVLFYLASVMSKPVLITMPLLLLLIDFWPFGRFSLNSKVMLKILVEKIPFIFLSGFICILLWTTQSKSVLDYIPHSKVLFKMIVCYADYIRFVFDPFHLGIRNSNFDAMLVPFRVTVVCVFFLLLIILSLFLARKWPYITFGFFWFVIALIPSAPLSTMGDRYLYIPIIGILIMLVWGLSDLFSYSVIASPGRTKQSSVHRLLRQPNGFLAMTVIVLFSFLFYRSWIQIGYWRNSESLFRRALEVSPNNALAMNNLGTYLLEKGKREEAKEYFKKAVRLQPEYLKPLYNLAFMSAQEGKLDDAIQQYRLVTKADPLYADAYYDLATLLVAQNRLEEALTLFRKSVEIKPAARAYNNIGFVLEREGKLEEAGAFYQKALELDPKNAEAQNNMGISLARREHLEESLDHFREAIRLRPNYPEARMNLGIMLLRLGREEEAKPYLPVPQTPVSERGNVRSYS